MSNPQQTPSNADLYASVNTQQHQSQWAGQLSQADSGPSSADLQLAYSSAYPSSTDTSLYGAGSSMPSYSQYMYTQPYSMPIPMHSLPNQGLGPPVLQANVQTTSPTYSLPPAPQSTLSTSSLQSALLNMSHTPSTTSSTAHLDDPYTYALQNGLPLPSPSPLSVPIPSRTNPLSNTLGNPTAALAYSHALPPSASAASTLEARGSARWTPAKLYTTPLRRADPSPTRSHASSKPSPVEKTRAGGKGGGSPRERGREAVQSGDEDEVESVVRSKKRRVVRDGTGSIKPSAPRGKRTADQAYIRALEANVERLKHQILGMGQRPFGLEGVNDTAAMSLDSAKLIIQAQQMDLEHVRNAHEEGKRENTQLRAAMNGTHASFLSSQNVKAAFASANASTGAPPPPAAGVGADRRGSIESVSSTSSVDSMTSASSFASTASAASVGGQAGIPSIPSMQWTLWNQAQQAQGQQGGK